MLVIYPVRVTAVYIELLRFAEIRAHVRKTRIHKYKLQGEWSVSVSNHIIFSVLGSNGIRHIPSNINTFLPVQIFVNFHDELNCI
jgi:hypothetical protein